MSDEASMNLERAFTGCLLGCAVGDALGLPREGLASDRARRLYGADIRPQLIGRRAMVSDDTEHLLMTACSLLEAREDFHDFQHGLARRLRLWLTLLPPAAGLSTLRGCFWLLLFVPPDRSGVPSAGNGPLMRAPIIGLYMAHDVPRLRQFVRASTRLTHTDLRAEHAAQIVALAAGSHLRSCTAPAEATPDDTLEEIRPHIPEPDEELAAVLARARDPEPLADAFPDGPSGYAYHTLLAVLHSWLHHRCDYEEAVKSVIELGGDTDTTAAVLGALVGAGAGPSGIPDEWLGALREWPHDVAWMEKLGHELNQAHDGHEAQCPAWRAGLSLLRNLYFLVIVLGHGFYRLFRLGGRI